MDGKKQDGYLVPNYLTKDHSPKNTENLMTCKCTIQIPVDVVKILSVAQKLVYIQKVLALIPNNGQVVQRAMKNMMMIVTRNMKRKTMMTSHNQHLAIVIINIDGLKDLQIDLHDCKLYSKVYSEPSQASEMKLFEKMVNS